MPLDPPARWRLVLRKSHALIKQTVGGSARDVINDFLFPQPIRTADHAPTADEALYWDESGILQLIDTNLPTGAVALGFDDIIYLAPSVVAYTGSASTVSQTVTITATGTVGKIGDATVAETVTTTTTGTVGKIGNATSVAETVTVTSTGTVGKVTGATVSETVTVTTAGTVGKVGAASLSESVTITATGSVLAGAVGDATLTETVTVSTAGSVAVFGDASSAATVTITASGAVSAASGATADLSVAVVAAGAVVTPLNSYVQANVSASASGYLTVKRIWFDPPTRSVAPGRKVAPATWWVQETKGVNLVKRSGVWSQNLSMDEDEITSAERCYLGGRRYEIDETAKAELVAAGYGSGITEEYVNV